jgi:2-methylcitrate dehydratase PrpD
VGRTNTDTSDIRSMTRHIARVVALTQVEEIPAFVMHETARVLLDSVGCAVAGNFTRKGQLVVDLQGELGGNNQASVFGTRLRTSCTNAAFANAELMNAIDFDAVFLNISHFVPVTVPAAVAVAEKERATGKDVLAAIAIANELCARLTLALVPVASSQTGAAVIQPTWGYGFAALGAAAAAARLLGLDETLTAHALGIAGYYVPVPGLLKWTRTIPMSMIKYSPMGWTAQAGVLAALQAAHGYTGDPTILDGDQGFAQFWGAPQYRERYLLEDWGTRWYSIDYLSFKPYPICNLYRPHLGLLGQLLARERLTPDEIEQITLQTGAVAAADRPYAGETELSEISAHNSGEYGAALVAYGITPGPQWVEASTRTDPRVRAFGKRVHVVGNPKTTEVQYDGQTATYDPERLKSAPSTVTVLARGKTWTASTTQAKGDAWGPSEVQMSDEELARKFRENCSGLLAEGQIAHVIDLILQRFTALADIRQLTGSLVPASN